MLLPSSKQRKSVIAATLIREKVEKYFKARCTKGTLQIGSNQNGSFNFLLHLIFPKGTILIGRRITSLKGPIRTILEKSFSHVCTDPTILTAPVEGIGDDRVAIEVEIQEETP